MIIIMGVIIININFNSNINVMLFLMIIIDEFFRIIDYDLCFEIP